MIPIHKFSIDDLIFKAKHHSWLWKLVHKKSRLPQIVSTEKYFSSRLYHEGRKQ